MYEDEFETPKILKKHLASFYKLLIMCYFFSLQYIRMDHLRHQKYKSKQLEINF